MNVLTGYIESVASDGNLTVVGIDINDYIFKAIIIGNAENTSYLKLDTKIELLFNESEVIIGKRVKGLISVGNQFGGRVSGVNVGKIFTNISLSVCGTIVNSLITSVAFKELGLRLGDVVEVYIKMNEIFLKQPDIYVL